MATNNLYKILRQNFSNNMDATFLSVPGGDSITYGEMDELSAKLASALRQLDVMPGDRICVQVEKSPYNILLYLACLRINAVYIPFNVAYTLSELDYFLRDSQPKLVVCQAKTESAIRPLIDRHKISRLSTLDANGSGTLTQLAKGSMVADDILDCEPDDLAAIMYTSGTTGQPKGAMLSHANLSSNGLILKELWNFQAHDTLLHALPIYHVHGLFVALHCAILSGSKVWLLPYFDQNAVIDLIPKSTVLMGVPTFYVRLLNDRRLNKNLCSNMRLFTSGSAPLPAEIFQRFESITSHRILERYGMTEAGMISSNPYDCLDEVRIVGTVGFALPGVELRLRNDQGKKIDNNEAGLLEIKGQNVFKGYWSDSEKTSNSFHEDGFFITGDIARIDPKGRLSILGRATDLIISGGLNVYPKEVETQIDKFSGVDESAVIGVPHPDFGEGVVAIIVHRKSISINKKELQLFLAQRLAKFKRPKKIFFVQLLPRNAMGKIKKDVLRQEYAKCFIKNMQEKS